jgi:acyl-CoA synthetase (AMP-forming)/AMP-acid ligase II
VTIGRSTAAPTEQSLVEILRDRARSVPDRRIFCFLDEGEFETESLTYGQLELRSCVLAAELLRCAKPGDRALLVYPPGLEFIAALFACFQAGVIAVPIYPPRWELLDDGYRPMAQVAANCRPAVVLTGGIVAEAVVAARDRVRELASARFLVTDDFDETAAARFQPAAVSRDTVALLQYTSGSTGDPKGVEITHGNILANEHVIQLALHHRTQERPGTGVCWLPFYHDMGLIGNVLQAVYVDGPCYLMSPLTLLQRPVRWLEAISKYRAHTSCGPNFAFDLCVDRISDEQKQSLDLSSWEVAAIGAEPVSARTIDRFTAAFASCGFRREAFYPCYGLAEATLFVSGGDKQAPPTVRSFAGGAAAFRSGEELKEGADADLHEGAESQLLVGSGRAFTDHEVVIVGPETRRVCAPGAVGEIWVRGPSVARGYWERPEDTKETFHAFLSDSRAGPYLRTGDLGFFSDGELFVSGRLKDLIVIRGQNHYPQDIEATVAEVHPAFRPNTGAAFGCLRDGEERLVIVQEIDRQSRKVEPDALARDIRRAVAERHQLQAYDVVFLRNGSLPRTTSGKIRRHDCRERYEHGRLTPWKAKPSV